MELRHLRYFVAVAEERHFTKAAERLGISQPPLSLQIRQLEQEMGTSLFRHLTRGVELTEAGALLLEEAWRILEHVERTKTKVQSRARGETGQVHVGFAGATSAFPGKSGHVSKGGRTHSALLVCDIGNICFREEWLTLVSWIAGSAPILLLAEGGLRPLWKGRPEDGPGGAQDFAR